MSTLSDAHHNILNNPMFINHINELSKRTGLEKLLNASIPGASHDSSERYPPPICHPGTRKDYIERLTQLGLNHDGHTDRITWLKGPAGVGKSAIAQSCADALHSKNKLGASFFFSRPNHRDNPDCFFTSLAYQIAVKHDAYGTHLDAEINRDPTLVKKSLPHQFHFLFITPFAQPAIREEIGERVIIVDGLDECARQEAQVDIIQIIAESVRAKTTPFLWILLSRLEPKIVTTFDLPLIKSVSQHFDLPVSREIDKEILLYLADKLREIGREHDLALPWPSEEEVWALVDFCSGLFACAHAIIHFVGAESSVGPVGQLHAVLQLAKRSATNSDKHPLSALDELYTLIMERVPPAVLQTVQWILLTTRVPDVNYAYESANLLGLSEVQLRSTCRCLHSVMSVGMGDWGKITFYHASFMDFLEDPTRSGQFYVWSDCAVTLLDEVVRHLDQMQIDVDAKALSGYAPRLSLTWPSDGENQRACYSNHVIIFFKVLWSTHLSNDIHRRHILPEFDFRKLSFDYWFPSFRPTREEVEILTQNLDLRLKLLRPDPFRKWRESFFSKSSEHYYTIGHGDKQAVLVIEANTKVAIEPYSPRLFKKWAKLLHEAIQPIHYSVAELSKMLSLINYCRAKTGSVTGRCCVDNEFSVLG